MSILLSSILETEKVIKQLIKLGLVKQYQKIKQQLLAGNYNDSNRLKLREPKSAGVWYFRINQKYRALAMYSNNRLEVFYVDDHQ